MQYVNSLPYEEVVEKKTSRCREDWYAGADQVACGFQYTDNEKVWDSQVSAYMCACVYMSYPAYFSRSASWGKCDHNHLVLHLYMYQNCVTVWGINDAS